MRKTCGEQLGKYEGCWPAEAVTREALTATRRGQGAVDTDPEEEDEMAETPKSGKRKTVSTFRAHICNTAEANDVMDS